MNKKLISIAIAIIMVLSLGIPALASNGNSTNGKVSNIFVTGRVDYKDYNNANFHCNAIDGNGRVWTTLGKDYTQQMNDILTFERTDLRAPQSVASKDTTWLLVNRATQDPIMSANGKKIESWKVTDPNAEMFICEKCGSQQWISFSNNSGEPDGKNIQLTHPGKNIEIVDDVSTGDENAAVSFVKKVGDKNIYEWLEDKGYADDEILSILDGLKFYLGTDLNPKLSDPVSPGFGGVVFFENIKPGTYTLIEEVTGAAIGKFLQMAPIELIVSEDGDGTNNIHVINGIGKVTIEGADFDAEDPFTIVNGYGSGYQLGYGSGNALLNNNGDIFPIAVTHVPSGKVFPSFCAHGGSANFAGQSGRGCAGYLISTPEKLAENENNSAALLDFVKAYNYIEANYGNLDEFRAVTQMVTWILLGNIDIDSDDFENINWVQIAAGGARVEGIEDAKDIVEDVIDNYADFDGVGIITRVIYMTCEHHHETKYCQPQLVPLYGKFYVENEPDEGGAYGGENSSVMFTKTKYGGLLEVDPGEFEFELFKFIDGAWISQETYPTGFAGVVFADNLEPGSYVFKEVIAHAAPYVDSTGSFALVYKAIYPKNADGLYFTIDANGDVAWRDTDDEVPSVNNVFYSKSYLLWVPMTGIYGCNGMVALSKTGERIILNLLGENSNRDDVLVVDNGFIRFGNHSDIDDWALAGYEFLPATCNQNASLFLSYGDGTAAMGGIELIGSALGHDFNKLSDDGVCLGCTRCALAHYYQDLDEVRAGVFLALIEADGRENSEGISYYDIVLAFYQDKGWFLD